MPTDWRTGGFLKYMSTTAYIFLFIVYVCAFSRGGDVVRLECSMCIYLRHKGTLKRIIAITLEFFFFYHRHHQHRSDRLWCSV